MSLINDALKRAKEAQQQAAPAPASNLQLRPIEPAQYTRPSIGLMLPAALAVVALLVLFFLWQLAHRTSAVAPTEVKARTAAPALPPSAPQAVATSVAPVPTAQPDIAPLPAPSTKPMPGSAGALGPNAASDSTNAPVAAAPDSAVANKAADIEAPPPKPAPTKLQGIVFSRTRPSVMIDSKTLFIGDKLNGYRVTAIDRESVTLVGTGQTNILTMAE